MAQELQPLALQLLREPRVCGVPAAVTATRGVYPDAVDVLWAEADNYPEFYQVFRAETNDPAAARPISDKIGAAFATKLNCYRDKSAQPGRRYTYWVKAGNPLGLSELSQPAEGQTGEGVATPRAYEPFDYPADTPVGGLAGGQGWKTPWEVKETNGSLAVNRDGLTYPGLRTAGRSLRLAPVDADETNRRRPPHVLITRALDREYGQDGTRVWTSFLIRAEKVRVGDLFVNIGRTGVGKGWGSRLCVYADAGRAMEPGKTYLVVVRYVFHKGNDLIHLWINPEPGKQPAADDAEVITRGYDNPHGDTFTIGMQPYGLGCYDVDELRVGATYEEVAPTEAKETKDSTGHR
jgi:hypothetical protein